MAIVKLPSPEFPIGVNTEGKVLHLADILTSYKKNLEYVLAHLDDAVGGGTIINNYPTEVTNSPVVLIDLYDNGMYTKYQDGTEYDWSFTKDGDGRITLIVNNTTAIETVVNWNEVLK